MFDPPPPSPTTGLVVLLVALVAVVSAVPAGLDTDCNCVYDWRGPHGYYNYWVNSDIVLATYHDADHWTPDPSTAIVPCQTCFVNIMGRAVTFIDQFVDINELQIGGNEWDDTIVVVGGPNRNNNANVNLRICMLPSCEMYKFFFFARSSWMDDGSMDG
jgi:hypothetical protein